MKLQRSGNFAFGLLLLRVGVGALMLFGHGLPKLMAWNERFHTFGDPLGVGSEVSYLLAVFAEVFCSVFLMLGWWTRLAVIPLIITMLVAAFIVHGADPWGRKEMAILYLMPFLTLLITGPGRYSLDRR